MDCCVEEGEGLILFDFYFPWLVRSIGVCNQRKERKRVLPGEKVREERGRS